MGKMTTYNMCIQNPISHRLAHSQLIFVYGGSNFLWKLRGRTKAPKIPYIIRPTVKHLAVVPPKLHHRRVDDERQKVLRLSQTLRLSTSVLLRRHKQWARRGDIRRKHQSSTHLLYVVDPFSNRQKENAI